MNKRQFNLDHHQIHEALQGARLSTFGIRAFCLLLDFTLIFLISSYLAWVFWVVVLLLMLNKKFREKFHWRKSKEWIEDHVDIVEQKAETIGLDERKQVHIRKYLRMYGHLLVHFVFILVIIFLSSSLWVSLAYLTENDTLFGFNILDLGFIGNLSEGLGVFFNTFTGLAYFTFFTWYFQGQTPAKRLFRIRVMKLNGHRLSMWNSLERVTGYVSSASLLGLGFLQVFWDLNHQATHDKISETVVVNDSPILRQVVMRKKKEKNKKEKKHQALPPIPQS